MTRDDDEFLRAIERVAVVLDEAGMPRMAARVYAYMLVAGDAPYSAADLGEALQVSPAAISGAVGLLARGRLVRKERAPGSRADRYRLITTDLWTAITAIRSDQLLTWNASLEEAAEILGSRTRAGRRMHQSARFLAFMRQQNLAAVQEWEDRLRRRPRHVDRSPIGNENRAETPP